MMMILGVALWLFPRPARDDVQYNPLLAELAGMSHRGIAAVGSHSLPGPLQTS